MKKNYLPILFIVILALAASCSSGYKSMKKGDYYKAVSDAVEKLRSSPRNEKAQYVLTKAYPLAEKAVRREIENALLSNTQNNYETVVYNYERMNQLANAIFACPKANELIPNPVTFYAELSDAKQKAAEQTYALGTRALNAGTLDQARLALKYFQKTNDYVYGYRDALNLMEQARYEATMRVVVEKPVTRSSYQISADFFADNLMSDISTYFERKMIRFYNFNEVGYTQSVKPHQYLVLNFEDFSVGNVFDSKNTVEYKRDSVKVGTAKINGKTVDVYNTVTAKYHTYRREIKSGGILSVRIFDGQNRLLQQRNFSGEYVWYTTWNSYNGDERALSSQQIEACNRNPQTPPSHQQLFIEFTKPIYTQTSSYIKSFYNKY